MDIESSKLLYLISQIQLLIENAQQLRNHFHWQLEKTHLHYQASATNLVDYLALRQFDIRELQDQLSQLGLSSLGRSEGNVIASLSRVSYILHSLLNKEPEPNDLVKESAFVTFQKSKELLKEATERLLGAKPSTREVRIMVTLPSEAAENEDLVEKMLLAGMDTARINCAHDDANVWSKIIQNVRKVAFRYNRECKIMMDLAGPKLRTGKLSKELKFLKLSPQRNLSGQVSEPTPLFLFPENHLLSDNPVQVPVIQLDEKWIQKIQMGSKVFLKDMRGKWRILQIVKQVENGWEAHSNLTVYINKNTIFRLDKRKAKGTSPICMLGIPQPLILKVGDILELHKQPIIGSNAVRDNLGNLVTPAKIACEMSEIFDLVKVGEPVKLNDGKIEGLIQEISPEILKIQITLASDEGSKLREEKGINFPETNIHLDKMPPKDVEDLDFISQNADMVALSFVHTPDDVQRLIEALKARNAENLGIILKIETQSGFNNLPWLLLSGMQHPKLGIMIARGDLAVECGWVRMAEIQEEILWLCEAAHVPVVWATQVLENLAQKGIPSRAEITDAAMSQRAECVMLNKGKHILRAIDTLNEILNKMQNHQKKKSAKLRKLSVTNLDKMYKEPI
ncbi:MAG: pyruvate kinase [Thermoflexibacter sp.]|jgi:pyruvate kinase|nr:pyruvate kinase [Thermoflexibacter sp.]